MNIVALVLAAGQASRFGRIKQLEDIDGQPMLNYVIKQHQLAGITDIVVVLGANADKIAKHVDSSIQVVIAKNWQLGMGESIRIGVNSVNNRKNRHFHHILISLADQIDIKSAKIAKLCTVANENPNMIVAAEYENNVGAPACFPITMMSDLLDLNSRSGAKRVILTNKNRVIKVAIPEAHFDIDTTEDLRLWRGERHSNSGEKM